MSEQKNKKVCIINAVGLTKELADRHPFFKEFGQINSFEGIFPALTCSVQASLLTGKQPSEHGIVGNGWLYPDTKEIRFWQQSHSLIQSDSFLKNRKVANLFWWFALGSKADYFATPRPHYGSNGDKAFGIIDETGCELEKSLGKFPFHQFWGPFAGRKSSTWIANATATVMLKQKPEITLSYLPHLDYDFQRFGPIDNGHVEHLITCIKTIQRAANAIGAQVIILSEYGIIPVDKPVFINRILREEGLLKVRSGPFGETLDTFESKAFAVVDHQIAHIYTQDIDSNTVKQLLSNIEGIDKIVSPEEVQCKHSRSGKLIALSEPNAWFAWPYWLDNQNKPDFADSIDIHRKPGYDPCELNLGSKLNCATRLFLKKCGLKTRMSVIDSNAYRIKGSHGLLNHGKDQAVIISENPPHKMIDFKGYIDSILGYKSDKTSFPILYAP